MTDTKSGTSLTYDDAKIAIIGLGYVGLPLAVEFGKMRPVVGFDIDPSRIKELRLGRDRTMEVNSTDLVSAHHLTFADNPDELCDCRIFIVTVPTPIDAHKQPDLTALRRASEMVGGVMPTNALVIFESTVYPGATEEECVPVLEAASEKILNRDFFVGYSPERINPGDKAHRLPTITKVTSGSTPEIAEEVDKLYRGIVLAGTHKAPSIRVAEAAKVIENTQRDLNIALINELALIFARLGIDTLDVLDAAGTKWNFLPFRPGLVGGHCIGVDPYYLTHKAQAVGYHPEVVLAGRRINDAMGSYVANRLVREMIQRDIAVKGARVLVLGLTFKENCPDLRNTRVVDILSELKGFGITVDSHDPWASAEEAAHEYGISLVEPKEGAYDGIILAVAHDAYREMGLEGLVKLSRTKNCPIFDLKGLLNDRSCTIRL